MTAYSRRPEAISSARQFLIDCAGRNDDELPTYADVAETYGGIARAVGQVNGQPVTPGSFNLGRWREELRMIQAYDWESGTGTKR